MNFARAVQVFQLLRQGAWMLMLLALARSGLALVEVGTFESLRYLGSLLTIPLITALGQAFLRVRQDASEARRWTTYFVLVLLLSGLTAGGLMAFGSEALGAILLDVQDLPFGLPYGLFVLGVYAGTLVEQEAIADQNAPRLLGYAIGSYGLQIIGFALPLALGYGLDAAIWGLSSTVVYRVGWLAWRHFRTGVADLPPASERKLFWSQANSLSVYGAFAVLVVIVDHFLVGHWSTDSEANLALWRYGSQELPLVVGVVAGLNATALAERQRGSDFMLEGLLRRSRRSIKYLLGLACLIMVASPYIYGQLLSESLYPAHAICNTMLLVLPSRLVQTQPLMISEDLQRQMLTVGIVESVINVAVSLALLPAFGLLGIAIGTVVAYSFERLAYVELLRRRGHLPRSYVPLGWLWGMSALLLVLYFVFTDFDALVGG